MFLSILISILHYISLSCIYPYFIIYLFLSLYPYLFISIYIYPLHTSFYLSFYSCCLYKGLLFILLTLYGVHILYRVHILLCRQGIGIKGRELALQPGMRKPVALLCRQVQYNTRTLFWYRHTT